METLSTPASQRRSQARSRRASSRALRPAASCSFHRARDRTARLADFFVAAPGLGLKRPRAGEMDAIDVLFGDSKTTQPFLIGPATVAVPGVVAGLEAAHRALRPPPVARPARACDRDGPRRDRADTAAGPYPRDARPDHPPYRRGAPDLQQPERLTARGGRPAALSRARRDVRGDLPSWVGRALRAASGRGRSSRPCATAGET